MEIVSHPASVILLIIFILSVAFLIYVEFSLLVYMVYAGFDRQIITFKSIFKNAFVNVRKLVGVPVIFFVIYLMLMIPIANLGLSSVLTKIFTYLNFNGRTYENDERYNHLRYLYDCCINIKL